MATVLITITDGVNGRVAVTCESRNPEIPLDNEGDPCVDHLSGAQAVGVATLMGVCDMADDVDYRTLLKRAVV